MSAAFKTTARANYRKGFIAEVTVEPKSKGTWTVEATRSTTFDGPDTKRWTSLASTAEIEDALTEAFDWAYEISA